MPDEDSSSLQLLKQQELRMQRHKVHYDIHPNEAGFVRIETALIGCRPRGFGKTQQHTLAELLTLISIPQRFRKDSDLRDISHRANEFV